MGRIVLGKEQVVIENGSMWTSRVACKHRLNGMGKGAKYRIIKQMKVD